VTHRYVDEVLPPKGLKEALNAYRTVAETGNPNYSEHVFNLLLRTVGSYRLMLPFRWREDRVDLILLCIYPQDADLLTATDWRSYR